VAGPAHQPEEAQTEREARQQQAEAERPAAQRQQRASEGRAGDLGGVHREVVQHRRLDQRVVADDVDHQRPACRPVERPAQPEQQAAGEEVPTGDLAAGDQQRQRQRYSNVEHLGGADECQPVDPVGDDARERPDHRQRRRPAEAEYGHLPG
jgi:hypothetical protein